MRQITGSRSDPGEKIVKDIKRANPTAELEPDQRVARGPRLPTFPEKFCVLMVALKLGKLGYEN